ncbi:MAG: peptidylprolyl isomerase [Bacillota bacterium]
MRKYAILMVLLAFVVAAVSGCGLIVKDAAVDAQTVIIEVAGKTFAKAEVQQAIQNVLDYQEYIYGVYGMSFDRTDVEAIASAQDNAINSLIEEAVTWQKVTEYGLDQFTQEELAAINTTVEDTYANITDTVKAGYFAQTELTGAELDAAVNAKILEIGYSSKEEMLEQEKQATALDKLRDMAVRDVTVTEDEIQEQYATNVSQAIQTYTETLTQYASDVSNGAILYFSPPGYRYVKNLLIKISDEDMSALSELSTQLSDDQDTLSAIQTAVAELPEDPAADTEDQKKSREELTVQADALTAEIAVLTTQLSDLTEFAYSAIQPGVDEVLIRIAAGEAFDALIAAYGEDPGMTQEPQKSKGYLLCEGLTTYLDVFVNESMALKNVGDISEPFRSNNGIHIVQYASNLPDGQAKLSDIRDQIDAEILAGKQDTLYDETVSQWITDANAKIHADRLAD